MADPVVNALAPLSVMATDAGLTPITGLPNYANLFPATNSDFASYFPIQRTAGVTNPMVGAELVQGQNPQPLGLDPIIAAVQSQYTPEVYTQTGSDYGAGRFGATDKPFDDSFSNIMPQWFLPGEYNASLYAQDIPTNVASRIATGDIYTAGGDSSMSPVSNVGDTEWMNNPYSSLFNPIDPLIKSLVGSAIPFGHMILGGAQGYRNALGTNALTTALGAYGSEGVGNADPFVSAMMGAFNITPDAIKNAKSLTSNFTDEANMFGYFAAATDPAISQIANHELALKSGQSNWQPTANEVGALGREIGEKVNSYVAQGKSLPEAVMAVAVDRGIDSKTASEYSANTNTDDPLGQLITNLIGDQAPKQAVDGVSPKDLAYDPAKGDWVNFKEAAKETASEFATSQGGVISQTQAENIANSSRDPIGTMAALKSTGIVATDVWTTADGRVWVDGSGNPIRTGGGTAVSNTKPAPPAPPAPVSSGGGGTSDWSPVDSSGNISWGGETYSPSDYSSLADAFG